MFANVQIDDHYKFTHSFFVLQISRIFSKILAKFLAKYPELLKPWIGRRGPTEYPARSPDLTPMDFFFVGILKRQRLWQQTKDN